MPEVREAIALIVIGILPIVIYVVAPRLVHFTVRKTLETQADDLKEGGVTATELDKRSAGGPSRPSRARHSSMGSTASLRVPPP